MTTSSLYHTQGIVGFNYEKTERAAGTEIYYLRPAAKLQPCPQCRSWNTSLADAGRHRNIRGLCIGLKKR